MLTAFVFAWVWWAAVKGGALTGSSRWLSIVAYGAAYVVPVHQVAGAWFALAKIGG